MPDWTNDQPPKAAAMYTFTTTVTTAPVRASRRARPAARKTAAAITPRTARAAPPMLATRWLSRNSPAVMYRA